MNLVIQGWKPSSLNVLLAQHWARRRKLKNTDAQVIALSATQARLPRATRRRRVDVRVYVGRRGRLPDADNLLKSLLDGLVQSGQLLDDGPHACELGEVRVERASDAKGPFGPRTEITLTDLEGS